MNRTRPPSPGCWAFFYTLFHMAVPPTIPTRKIVFLEIVDSMKSQETNFKTQIISHLVFDVWPLRLCHVIFKFVLIFQIIFLACTAVKASNQSTVKIQGYVFSGDGEILAGANVVVLGSGIGTATNAEGHFTIENLFAGEYDLRVTFMGYESETRRHISVGKEYTAQVSFRLKPVVLALDKVSIEASRENQTGSIFQEIISAEAIQKSSARTVAEILLNVAGVDIATNGGSGTKKISIRGSNANQVLVLLDGVPLNDPLSGEVDLNQVSLANVGKILVLKGGNSSLYGSGAVGGVIEIISKKQPLDEIRVNTRMGSYDSRGLQPSASGSFSGLDYFFSFETHSEKNDFNYSYKRSNNTILEESRLNSDFSSNNYFGKLILNRGNHSYQIQTNIFNSDRGLPGLVFSWTPYATAKNRRHILAASYSFQAEKRNLRFLVSQYVNETESENNPPADAPLKYKAVPANHAQYRIQSNRAVLESSFEFGQAQTVFLQTTLQNDDFKDDDLLSGLGGAVSDTDNLNFGLVARNEWQLPKPVFLSKLSFNHSLRFDLISYENSGLTREDQFLSPRFGLLISPESTWLLNFKLNAGRSFRAPTFADLFFQDFRVEGNADLLPEKSIDFDAGVQMGIPVLGWLEISGNYFSHKIENLIVWELGSFATWQPTNTDAMLKGWEFAAGWNLWKERLKLDVSHVILDAVNRSERPSTQNKIMTYRPEQSSKIGLLLNFSSVALNYDKRIVGARFVTSSNTIRMPAYTVDDLSLGISKQFGKVKSNLKGTVYNFFDESYEMVENAPLPGRHWRVSVELVY